MTSTVRLGLLSFAHHHQYRYADGTLALPDVEIAAIRDDDRERGQATAEHYHCDFEPEIARFLAHDDIDGVSIATENVFHARYTILAANAGKHVLCEKPLATSVADAEGMIAACAANNVMLQTAFPVRYVPATIALREAVRSGAIGTPLAVAARNPGYCPQGWFVQPELSGGGAVMDHTVHVVDVLRWIFDTEVTEVSAEVDTRIYDFTADDTELLMLTLSDSLPVSLDTTWSRPDTWPIWGGVTIDVIGDEGVASLDAFTENVAVAISSTSFAGSDSTSTAKQAKSYAWRPANDMGDEELIRGFAGAIRDDTDATPSGVDGMRAMGRPRRV
jgi:predicted dehydrogenase